MTTQRPLRLLSRETVAAFSTAGPRTAPRVRRCATRGRRWYSLGFAAGHAQGECLISTDVQADRGARNQPTKEEIDHVQDQEITGAASEERLMSKLKTLFSSRKKMMKTTPKAKMPGRRK
jgi:hypothetical protein